MQNPIPAYAYGQNPSSVPKLIQVDANGFVIPSGTTDSLLAVPAPNATTNAFERDVIGNKTDTAVEVVGSTASLAAYVKGLLTLALASGGVSDNAVATSAAALTQIASPGVDLFNITGGPIEILSLFSLFTTVAGATATTLQYLSNPTLGALALNLSAACTTLSAVAAGTTVTMSGTSAATAPVINLAGSGTAQITTTTERFFAQVGNIAMVVGGASNTGLVQHFLRYRPLAPGALVTAAF